MDKPTQPLTSDNSTSRLIKKLSAFGDGFKHHHENYESGSIADIRQSGGVWDFGDLSFHFPEHFGFCYGVDKAIDMVFETCARFPDRRIFLTDQLIHNPFINSKLKERGVHYLERDPKHLLVCDALKKDDVVVVSAFGTDFRDIQSLKDKGVTIVDSTCGAIINVWKRVEHYAKNGFITVVHGKRQHEETRATVSQALKEGGSTIIIENLKEAHELAKGIRGQLSKDELARQFSIAVSDRFNFDAKDWRMGMANQTTMLKGESLEIQEILRNAFIERFGKDEIAMRFKSFDTICGATQDRQDALRTLLEKKLDLLLIVGGYNSSNTAHLAEIAHGKAPLYHIQGPEDILSGDAIQSRDPHTGSVQMNKNWFHKDMKQIGVTSGASTPDVMLIEVIQKVRAIKKAI